MALIYPAYFQDIAKLFKTPPCLLLIKSKNKLQQKQEHSSEHRIPSVWTHGGSVQVQGNFHRFYSTLFNY